MVTVIISAADNWKAVVKCHQNRLILWRNTSHWYILDF